MEIATALLKAPYIMNEEQRTIISHKRGPLLVVAGPGSGKTRSLTLLAMNLLLCGNAEPSQIVLCTYTEKAAYELHDRLTSIARNVHYPGDLSQLKIGTIHGVCQQLVNEYLHHTSLSSGYEMLNHFTQQLLIFDHLEEICPKSTLHFFQDRWGTRWDVAGKFKFYFDTIAEELVFETLKADVPRLKAHQTLQDTLLHYLTYAYDNYRRVLVDTNSTDFAHLQKWAYKLLHMPHISEKIIKGIRYVLVDEYQDTNYIQEQILILLASGSDPKNLIVIGDEDQALYRFRGATVRNILTFITETFPESKKVLLTANYRSQAGIIAICNQWIKDFDWSNGDGSPLRTEKSLRPGSSGHPYLSTIYVDATDVQNEAEQFADIVDRLKKQRKIEDYSDVAFLLYSVRPEKSEPYVRALNKQGIPVYCPRARAFFQQEEIMLLLGCFARILHYSEEQADAEVTDDAFSDYLANCQQKLASFCQRFPVLARELQRIEQEMHLLCEGKDVFDGQRLAESFYRMIFEDPFLSFQQQEHIKNNLVSFSRLIETFQRHYCQHAAPTDGLQEIRTYFFDQFFFFLYQDGANEDGDQQQPFLKGHVHIMTIHQAKGLEFPVVLIGRLDKLPTLSLDKERFILQPYFHHPPFEPVGRIPGYDRRRLYYVALSRARNLLVLSAIREPHADFRNLCQDTLLWKNLRDTLHTLPKYVNPREDVLPKPRYGFTTHMQTYQTCPRRYHYLYEHRFAPSHQVDSFFGQLVHQTIERLHRAALDGAFAVTDEERVRKIFEKMYTQLLRTSAHLVTSAEKERALRQVLTYYQQNQREIRSVQAAEFPVQIDRNTYTLQGKIDLLVDGEKGLEVFDFKTSVRPTQNSAHLTFYKQQLYFYAYALQKYVGQLPQRLWLYWTAEEQKENALMEVAFDKSDLEMAVSFVDELATKIHRKQFEVKVPPAPGICHTCDIRRFCKKEGLI